MKTSKKKIVFLHNEINKNIDIYIKKINTITFVPPENNNNNIFKTLKVHTNNVEFTIKKEIFNETHEKVVFEKKVVDYNKILKFIWFLNDYDGELVFWKNYPIRPKSGTLIIFPTSWCFPYEDIMITNSTRYIITGNIQHDY